MKTLLGTEGGTERVIFLLGRKGFYFTVKMFGRRVRVFALGRGLRIETVRT